MDIELSADVFIKLYKTILKIRKVELKIEELYPQDEMKTPVHLCIGQEAVAAGVCLNLKETDYVFSNHRGHGHFLAKGGSLKELIAELYGRETGCSRGRGGSMHLVAPEAGLLGSSSIVGGGIPIAVGAALGAVLQDEDRVSVAFFGDAGSEEGVFYESMNFAVLRKLPVIFICENNFYSVCSHQSARQATSDISMRPRAFDMPSYKVDGADAIAVYIKAKEIIERARTGGGPSFLECLVYRWRGHSGPGDPLKSEYRKADEWEKWIKRCPLKMLEEVLLGKNILDSEKINKINQALEMEIEDAFRFARESPLPEKTDIMKYLYRD